MFEANKCIYADMNDTVKAYKNPSTCQKCFQALWQHVQHERYKPHGIGYKRRDKHTTVACW